MTDKELCSGKTFKEVMQEVDFHISDKQRIAELKEKLRQKSDTNHSLVEQLADKEIVISELKEQIEKMKCCGNCKHFSFPLNVCYAHERQVWKTFEDTISCGKWELAE